jgi:hypothetical protein
MKNMKIKVIGLIALILVNNGVEALFQGWKNIPTGGVRLSPEELKKFLAQQKQEKIPKLQTSDNKIIELSANQWIKLFSESVVLQNLVADLGSLVGQTIPVLLTAQELNFFLKNLFETKEQYDFDQIASLVKGANYFDMKDSFEKYLKIFAPIIEQQFTSIKSLEGFEKLYKELVAIIAPDVIKRVAMNLIKPSLMQYLSHPRTLSGHAGKIYSIAWSPDGTKLASGSTDDTINIWNMQNYTFEQDIEGHTGTVTALAWSPDGTKLTSGSKDDTIKIWDGQNYALITTLQDHTKPVNSIAWNSSGTKFISGSGDHTIKVWDGQLYKIIKTIRGHENAVFSVAWSPDGTKFASSSLDNTIKIWNGQTYALIATLQGGDTIYSVAWSPDGPKLASGSRTGIKIWDFWFLNKKILEQKLSVRDVLLLAFITNYVAKLPKWQQIKINILGDPFLLELQRIQKLVEE